MSLNLNLTVDGDVDSLLVLVIIISLDHVIRVLPANQPAKQPVAGLFLNV